MASRSPLGEDPAEALFDERQRFLPARLDQLALAADQRSLQPVRVGVELTDARALRADEAAAEDVVGVAADLDDLVALQLHLETARRFAKRTGTDVGDARRAHLRNRSSQRTAPPVMAAGLTPSIVAATLTLAAPIDAPG